jgi:hypothetical protein
MTIPGCKTAGKIYRNGALRFSQKFKVPGMVANFDNEEITLLAFSLQCAGAELPLIDIPWHEAWIEGLVSAEDVIEAARDELQLGDE